MWRRWLPFLAWFGEPREIGCLRADVIAGVTVAMVLVPQSMAYAQLAGLPPIYGLYAAFLPSILAALFGSSRQLSTGPVAVVSLMTAAALEPLAVAGGEGYVAHALLLAVMVGVFQLALGLLRLGVLVDLFSHPVVLGFTNAGAIIIAASQLGKLFGVSVERGDYFFETIWNTVAAIPAQGHGHTFLVALLAFGLMLLLARFFPRIPAVLVAVAATTLLSIATGFAEAGGKVVGEVPVGLPSFTLPGFEWDTLVQLLPAVVTISLIGFTEAISISKSMAARTRQKLDPNQELIGQGLGNITAGLSSGYPVAGSFSRSAVNINAGAVSGFSSVVTGLAVGATLLWLTPLLYHLPQATLAAVIIVAVGRLIGVRPMFRVWRVEPHDGMVALVTFLLTLLFAPHLEQGILAGVGLSLVLFVVRTMRPRVSVLSRYHDGSLRDAAVYGLPTSDYIAMIRFDGVLYFGNAGYFEERVLEAVAASPKLRYLIIHGDGIVQIDATGDEVMRNLVRRLHDVGIEVLMVRVKKQVMDKMKESGLFHRLGEERFFHRTRAALMYAWDGLGELYDPTTCPLARQTVSNSIQPL